MLSSTRRYKRLVQTRPQTGHVRAEVSQIEVVNSETYWSAFPNGLCFVWGAGIVKQEMSLSAPPRGNLPEWGRRFEFETFFVELVPAGKRSFNVRLAETFASISFSVDEGQSSLAGDRLRNYDRRPYEYIVTPAGFPLRGESEAAPEVLVLVFQFDELKADIAAALRMSQDILESRVIVGGPKPLTTAIAQHIRRHILADAVSHDYLRSLCLILIVEMMRLPAEQRSTGRGSTLNDNVLQSMLNFIDANLEADLSLEALARLAGVLTHQFARAFKRKVGEAPHRYVLSRRIEAARILLCKTEDPIADIAYATGFSSQSHMTTTFRRELSMTPAQLRSQNAA